MIAGDVVNTAARLQTAAPVGAVLVGEETYLSTRAAIEYQPAFQPVKAKGKAEPVRAWIALRAECRRASDRSTPVPMVGRERQLEVLTGVWERVVAERRPHLVTVFGPAGIGKSRLALELMEHVGAAGRPRPARTLDAVRLVEPVRRLRPAREADRAVVRQRRAARGAREAGGRGRRARRRGGGARSTPTHLALLIGLGEDGDVADRETLFFSARVLVESLGAEGPTLLLFEDIHWADASLLDLLETLASRVRDVPVLFLALARPELLNERPGWAGGLPAYTALPLDRLTDDDAQELATLLLARFARRPSEPAETVAETAEGNPLFIEELAASLGGALDRRGAAAADERPRDRRGAARRAASRRAKRPRRRRGRRARLLARRAVAHRAARGALQRCSARSRSATSSGARPSRASAATSSSRSSTR